VVNAFSLGLQPAIGIASMVGNGDFPSCYSMHPRRASSRATSLSKFLIEDIGVWGISDGDFLMTRPQRPLFLGFQTLVVKKVTVQSYPTVGYAVPLPLSLRVQTPKEYGAFVAPQLGLITIAFVGRTIMVGLACSS